MTNTDDWKGEALEWTRATFTLDEIRDELESGFGIERERNSVRNLFVALGIEPAIKMGSGDNRKGRGRVGYYDPLATWVAAVAYRAVEVDRSVLRSRLDAYRDRANKAVWGRLASSPSKRRDYDQLAWDWRVESVAYHLFISDLDHGLDPRAIHGFLTARPRLLNLTLDGNWHLENVLRVYVSNYMRENAGAAIDPNDVNLFGDSRRPLSNRKIEAVDRLGVLDQFKVLRAGGPRLSEPDHVDIDAIDIYSEGEL